jgi:hypothetical protein
MPIPITLASSRTIACGPVSGGCTLYRRRPAGRWSGIDQHIGDDRALVCERYFGVHHDAPLKFRPAMALEHRKSDPGCQVDLCFARSRGPQAPEVFRFGPAER